MGDQGSWDQVQTFPDFSINILPLQLSLLLTLINYASLGSPSANIIRLRFNYPVQYILCTNIICKTV